MPHLKTLYLANASYVDASWAIPFASGGLSQLSLIQSRVDEATLSTILAVHANTPMHLELDDISPGSEYHEDVEFDRGPAYKLNRLEWLRILNIHVREVYLRRFSSSLIEGLEAIPSSFFTCGVWRV
jgi:hypothetical protein